MLGAARAQDFTAGFAMDRMEPKERYAYVSGIIEGLAYARYVDDGRDPGKGMRCIYEWYYDNGDAPLVTIYDAFERFRTYLPGTVVAAVVETECGEP